MINLYDGNNVAIRAATTFDPFNRSAMDLRLRYHKATAADLWVWDGDRHNERRRAIYPRYKTNREPLGQDVYSQIKLWRQLLAYSPAAQIEVPEWEADDVIATLARRLASSGKRVTIHSNDLDYAQLTANPLIEVKGIKKMPVSGRWIPLFKACVGDSSDFIAGIPGFGGGTWALMADHYQALEDAIVSGDPFAFDPLPLPKRIKTWLMDPGNIELVQQMLLIVHFFPVPEADLNDGVTAGKHDPQAADALLSRYFL